MEWDDVSVPGITVTSFNLESHNTIERDVPNTGIFPLVELPHHNHRILPLAGCP